MATRAAIIYIDGKGKMSATYNHYDGYPENLGKGLNDHYSDDFDAQKIASEGYISYMDPETGEIDQNNRQDPETYIIDDLDDAVGKLNDVAQGMGADYVYIYVPYNNSWVNIKNQGSNTMLLTLNGLLPDILGIGTNPENDPQSGDFMTEWKSFINENTVEKVMSQALFKLQDEPKEMLDAYKKSLANDIRLNGQESYADFSVEDFIEDYNEYVNDKMDF